MNHFPSFSNLRIGARLAVSFALLLTLLFGLTAVGVNRVGHINDGLRTISEVNGVKQRYAINFRGSVHNRAIALRDVVFEDSKQSSESQVMLINKLANDYTRSADPLDKMFASRSDISNDERSALAKIKDVETRALPLIAKVIELRRSDDIPTATKVLLTQARPAFNDWLDSINVLIDLEERMNQVESLNARSVAGSFQTLMLALCCLAVVLGIVIAWLVTRSIVTPIRLASDISKLIASGDLTVHIDSESVDETGVLLRCLKEMQASLITIVRSVTSGIETVKINSTEIARGNTDLSARTVQQASSLEETAASMTQLTETVKQNADNARQANMLATNATDMADAGDGAVQGMVGTIAKISDSSTKISEITGVIEGIAFQTNILALNAAVEAARAGEQGRGFAVVASEVRSLAQRSATAAKEIKELIGSSLAIVRDGSRQATEVSATMGQIKQAIKQVSDMVGEIAAASEEQSRGIEQVNQAVNQMDQVTQQNATLVGQAATAAQSLEEQAMNLIVAVSAFKVADTGILAS